MKIEKQFALRPQDIVVMLSLVCHPNERFGYKELAQRTGLSASEAHTSLKRASVARLIGGSMQAPSDASIDKAALGEFLIYGARYAFPAVLGPEARGIPTAHAAPPLVNLISQTEASRYVWPDPEGEVRGISLYPLYKSIAQIAYRDTPLYELLALFDALRIGSARERDLAAKLMMERLA